jgi:hypothetical protein
VPRFSSIVWIVAVLGGVGWCAVMRLLPRYIAGGHSSYEAIGILFFGAIPLIGLGCALAQQLWERGRGVLGVLAILAGGASVLFAFSIIVSGELDILQRRRVDAERQRAADQIRAELANLPLAQLVEIFARGAPDQVRRSAASSMVQERLERMAPACAPASELVPALSLLASLPWLAVDGLTPIAHLACPSLKAPLLDAIVAGVEKRPGARSDSGLIESLVEADPTLLGRVHARIHFSDEASGRALESFLYCPETPERRRRALMLLKLGFSPVSAFNRPLSEIFRQRCDVEGRWPEGATADQLALHRALLEAEKRH